MPISHRRPAVAILAAIGRHQPTIRNLFRPRLDGDNRAMVRPLYRMLVMAANLRTQSAPHRPAMGLVGAQHQVVPTAAGVDRNQEGHPAAGDRLQEVTVRKQVVRLVVVTAAVAACPGAT